MEYDQSQAFGGVIDVLEAVGACYAIWGGMTVITYGEPRFTQDMDILLSPAGFDVTLFVRTLEKTHYHVDEITVRRAMGGGFFNVIHQHYQMKTDFYVPVDPQLRAMIAERIYLPFDQIRRAAYITPESVIITKLRAFEDSQSTRHLEDIASIVRIQGKKLDQERIDIASARMGLLGVWRAIWEENQPR